MSLRLGIVSFENVAGPTAGRLATGAGHWARLDDRLLVWGDELETARASGIAVQDAGEIADGAELRLVTQVGRLFQIDHPDVPVLVDKGRFLVVQLAEEQAARMAGHEEVCYKIMPLEDGMVVFERVAPTGRAPEPWIQDLVDQVARPSFEAALIRLTSFPTRHSLSVHYGTAATWAQDELRRLGYSIRTESITVGAGQSLNVIADRVGVAPVPRDLALVTAHLDSVNHPAGGGPNAPAPGADDNGSGSVAMLEIARVLARHPAKHDLRLILFGGEEQGLFGSRQYVATLPAAERTRVRSVINMDMVASLNTPTRTVLLEGAPVSQALMDQLGTAAATYTSLAVQRSLNPFASDHVPFINASMPAVLTIEGADSANANIHTAGDTLAHIDYDLALDIIRMNVATTAAALSISRTPGPFTAVAGGATG
jgi:Zn-dependent M28 family amino/carboxypeptidase